MRTYLCLILACLALPAVAQEYNYKTLDVNVATHYTFKNLRLYPIRANDAFRKSGQYVGKYTPLREALESQKIVISEVAASNTQPNTRMEIVPQTQNNLPVNSTRERQIRREMRKHKQETNQPRNTSRVEEPQAIQPQIQQIQTQQLQIRTGGGETVNTLQIQNVSKDTVYIMAGEIVQGGKQDRVLAQDLVLPPMSEKMNVSVFCVEQGRWQYKNTEGTQNFSKHYGVASQTLRKKVEKGQNQQAVWSEVRRSNNENNVQTETGAYTAQKDNAHLQKNIEEYLAYFQEALAKEKDIIGVLVATSDKVTGCDLFASPTLFQAQMKTLLPSYINEALTDGATVTIDNKVAQQYLDNLLKDETSQNAFIEQKGKMFKHQEKKLRISTF